jgi:tRNA threonylcarbamoyladenosine biosynthesis protein TsaE
MYRTHSQEDTGRFGAALGAHLRPGDSLLISGDLGAGKSVLARGVARALGVTGPMPSPTFTLMQPYGSVCHFDLYRLEDEDEFYQAGLDEFTGGSWIALIEWPFEGMDLSPRVEVSIERGETEDERTIRLTCSGMGERMAAIADALGAWEAET